MKTFFVFFFILSCAQVITPTSYEDKLIRDDLAWFSDLDLKNPLLKTIFKQAKNIEVSTSVCDPGQIACSRLINPNTVFITPAFFKLNKSMRVSTILHEAAHHYYRTYSHVRCQKTDDFNCDDKMDSPYGTEYSFYSELIRLEPVNSAYKKEQEIIKFNLLLHK